MLLERFKAIIEDYRAERPEDALKDPISLAVAVKTAREFRGEIGAFLKLVQQDEARYLARFNDQTAGADVGLPSRLASVPRQSTVIGTLREFVKRNRGEEFTVDDVVEACDLHGTPTNSVRGMLARLRDLGEIRRSQRGVYKATPRKKKAKAESEAGAGSEGKSRDAGSVGGSR